MFWFQVGIALAAQLLGAQAVASTSPVYVQVQSASFLGLHNATLGIESFRGVRYGHAERFRKAVPVSYSEPATINASFFGVACPQIKGTNALAADYGIYGTDEDCTLLDIYRPAGTNSSSRLPVMLWLHGGALTQGAASHYPADALVAESIKLDLPVIAISINYRLALWGFLGGREAAKNGALNLGLYDQVAALEWVQKYIEAFGGDKDKVTVFGQSSGAMSIAYHYLKEDTKLFRAAILQSGGSTSVPAMVPEKYQNVYNRLASITGCDAAANSFECLRTFNQTLLLDYVNVIFADSTNYSGRPWGVAIDGDVIPDSPSRLTALGRIARIPFISGNVHDEGTVFVKPRELNTTDDFLTFLNRDYVNRNATFFGNLTSVNKLLKLYPANPSLGSPFDTGSETFWGPQFKRAAAAYGDLHFQGPRRHWLDVAVWKGIPSWSYDFNQVIPGTSAWQGVYHTTEIDYVFVQFEPSAGADYELARQTLAYWLSFATRLDPNYHGNPVWLPYGRTAKEKRTLHLEAGNVKMIPDDYRRKQTDFLTSIADQFLEAPF